ncbi:hypothetical protein Pcinc_007369 [Petrolisthes cinctipes]|uniref:Uncharacterized protein n=1 Tax=Petrolisthes cinctipes TaxID=88211 RepID=A0AAE1G8U1_PETCI|nr:hypothetical protein Pcinc_007369 [Petrolisthes cinctipes]
MFYLEFLKTSYQEKWNGCLEQLSLTVNPFSFVVSFAGDAATQAIKKDIKIKKVDPKTGAEIMIEERVEVITDASPHDQQPQSVVGKHFHITIKSTTFVETDVILQYPTTGEEMSPEEAFSRGLISPTELEEIRSSAHSKIQEVQQMSDTKVVSLPEGSSNIPQIKDAEEMKSVDPQKCVLKLALQDSQPEGKDVIMYA